VSSRVNQLAEAGLIKPPTWLPDNVHFEVVTGSLAYGVSEDDSDFDVYGWCIPPKQMVFPHCAGEIPGFGRQHRRFDQYQQHHIHDPNALGGRGRTYDVTIYSIVRYFHLTMENNPNMLDALFTPPNWVLHSTVLGERVREKRRIFLHRGCWHKFKGYAYSQLSKMSGDRDRSESHRRESVERFGFDVKFAMHCVRLLDEVEQILETGDLVLGRNREQLKAIRRGEWTEQQVRDHFAAAEPRLQKLYDASDLPWGPDEDAIKSLLVECLEEHYGSIGDAVVDEGRPLQALRDIDDVLARVRALL
jgi:predicted nucleotidyltransferase